MNKKNFSTTFDKETYDKLKALAQIEEKDRNELIKEALERTYFKDKAKQIEKMLEIINEE